MAVAVTRAVERNRIRVRLIANQLLRSATSVGANLNEADNAMSRSDFRYRCAIARKEAAESRYWLRLCQEAGFLRKESVEGMLREIDEIIRILTTVIRKSH